MKCCIIATACFLQVFSFIIFFTGSHAGLAMSLFTSSAVLAAAVNLSEFTSIWEYGGGIGCLRDMEKMMDEYKQRHKL